MRSTLRLVRPTALHGALSGVLLLSLTAWLFLPSLYRAQQPLEPYVTVVTDRDPNDAAHLLKAAGAREVISATSTMVAVSRFSGVEELSLTDALARLDPLDPRRDPWITGLDRYFTIDGRTVLYARLDFPPARADRLVRRALGAGSRIAEWAPFRTAGALALYLVAAVGLVSLFGRGRALLVPCLLPWVPLVWAVGLPAAAASAALSVFIAWILANAFRRPGTTMTLAELARRSARHSTMLAAGLLVTAIYLVRLCGWMVLLPVAAAALGSLAAVGLGATLVVRRVDPDHRIFEPVSILPRDATSFVSRRWSRIAIVLAPILILAPPLIDAAVPGGAISRPVPTSTPGGGLDYGALWTLWGAGGRSDSARLPDVADYLAHRAYQDGLVYGRTYGFPGPDEQISLERFRERADGSYTSWNEPVFTYDERWLHAALSDAPAGIASMLAGLGYATGVVLSPSDTIYSGYSRFLQHLIYVVLVLSPFLIALLPWRRGVRTRDVIVDLARRRNQVA